MTDETGAFCKHARPERKGRSGGPLDGLTFPVKDIIAVEGVTGENAHYGTRLNTLAPGRVPGGSSSGSLASLCGAPQASLPLSRVDDCPLGLSILGPPGSDALVLDLARTVSAGVSGGSPGGTEP
jgi:Asp-tRNA(Asn)/Glu-tRNA(Gln) amidotransferase A subunit family amidase